ncbi:MAG: cytochrome P450 [Sphingobium sp.]
MSDTLSSGSRPVVDFNQHSERYASDGHALFDTMRESCPVAWSEAHGGFWVASRYEDVTRIVSEYESFSSDHDLPEEVAGFPSTGTGFRGVGIPEGVVKFVPSEADPPLSTAIRRLEAPFFTPKAINGRVGAIEAATDAALDAVMAKGRIEFSEELAVPIPIMVSLPIIGIGSEEWPLFAATSSMFHIMSDSPDYPYPQIMAVQARILKLVAERRASPQHDVASALVHGQVNGESLTDAQVGTILNGLSFAGAHTVTSLILFALEYLGKHPELRAPLLADPKLLDNALEELLRFYTPFQGAGRNVVGTTEVGGQTLRHGERIYASMAAANHDPAKFECPHEIRIDRPNAREHLAFSSGLHRCLGAGLAKVQAAIIVRKILQRLPDYEIVWDDVVRSNHIGSLNTLVALPAVFKPT